MKNLFNKITSLLFIVFIILSFKIINSNYYIDISNKEYLNNLFILTFNYNNLFNKNNLDINVNGNIKYIKLNNKYITDSSLLYSLKEGIIYTSSNKIIIKQNDGYDFVIEGEFNTFIFNGDYVEKDSIIGEYFKPFLLYFYKDDKLYSYEEYIRNSF